MSRKNITTTERVKGWLYTNRIVWGIGVFVAMGFVGIVILKSPILGIVSFVIGFVIILSWIIESFIPKD